MATLKTSTACLVGSTGLVGSHILSTLASHPELSSLYVYTRRTPPPSPPPPPPSSRGSSSTTSKVTYIPNHNPTTWPTSYPPDATILFSALGTTARAAGGFAAQRKIDYDLNIALAQAAKRAGATIYVLISTTGASPTSMVPYTKMKGELDDAVKGMGFEYTIILKPGLLVGTRVDSRPGEFVGRKLAGFLGKVSGGWLKDGWAQDADVVARAAVGAALRVVRGEGGGEGGGVWVLGQREIVRLGKEGDGVVGSGK